MRSKIDTIVQFSGLKLGRYEYGYVLDKTFFEGYENEELREGKVDFAVVLERKERMLMFTFTFRGVVKTTCDRCLGEMDVPVEGVEHLCVKFSDTETSEDENVVYLPEGAYQIDLAQWMYEYVAVRMPIQKVHAEGECDPEMLQYIADGVTDYGESDGRDVEGAHDERENDPRWDALKQLLDK
ncbi:MAG: DUF177 domain-containing protein [Bacteroidales bacterium]|nr:DUF177 domain-containing protein [Bacteroidales bacterium]